MTVGAQGHGDRIRRRDVWRLYVVDLADFVFFGSFLLLVASPWLLQAIGLYAPFWLVTPLIGVLFWRKAGFRWRDTLSWTVPVGIALWLTEEFAPASLDLPISIGLFGLVVAMIFVEPLAKRWVALVAPGHYTLLPDPDRGLSLKLSDLDDEYWRAARRHIRTGDTKRFRREQRDIRQKAERLDVSDAEWEEIRRLWFRYLAWYDERGDDDPASQEEFDDLDQRRVRFVSAWQALVDRRSVRLGGRPGPNTTAPNPLPALIGGFSSSFRAMDEGPRTIQDLFGELADKAGADTVGSAGTCEYQRDGRAFAAIDGDAAEVRLDPEIAEAVLRTPSTVASSRRAGWIRFAPPEFDQHARDRAEAWFLSAWRAAQSGEN